MVLNIIQLINFPMSRLGQSDISNATILSYIDLLVAVLISVTILGEKMTIWQIAGGVLILGFTLWNEVSPNTKIMGGRNVFSGSDC